MANKEINAWRLTKESIVWYISVNRSSKYIKIITTLYKVIFFLIISEIYIIPTLPNLGFTNSDQLHRDVHIVHLAITIYFQVLQRWNQGVKSMCLLAGSRNDCIAWIPVSKAVGGFLKLVLLIYHLIQYLNSNGGWVWKESIQY